MTDALHQRILAACLKLMVPLARTLLINGISYKEFDEVSRRAFVLTATNEFGLRGRATNTSRISAMTGLPRKEVRRLKPEQPEMEVDATGLLSPLADLLQVWATSQRFTDAEGAPRELGIGSDADDSFDSLVRLCMGDIPPGAVKAELVRLGAVRTIAANRVAMVRRSLIPPDVDARLESAILYSLKGLAETVSHNIDPNTQEDKRYFERFVESPPLTEGQISAMRSIVSERLTAITEELDELLSSSATNSGEADTRRVGIGIYYSE